jgi:hypothetical protein
VALETAIPNLITTTWAAALAAELGALDYGLIEGAEPGEPLPRNGFEVGSGIEDANTVAGTGNVFPVTFQVWRKGKGDLASAALGRIREVFQDKALHQSAGGALTVPAPDELSAIRFRSGGNVIKFGRDVFMGQLVLAFETWRAST